MITKEELKEYAMARGLKNLGHAEKDYFQNIILFILSQNYGKNLVFKGGTALNKCFGLNRFSEDLDFTAKEKISLAKLETGLKRFRIEFETENKEYANGLKAILRIKGPLYIGVPPSKCKLILDFSLRENILLKPRIKNIGRFLEEIPSFDVFVMQEKEILAEKTRAIMTRAKARDVYDLWFLLEKGILFDKDLVEKKLEYYKEKWSFDKFAESITMKKIVWETELKPTITTIPDFNKVKKEILQAVKSTF